MIHQLPLEISREDHLWMARSSAIRGLLVTGETFFQLLDALPTVTQALFESCRSHGWVFVIDTPEVEPGDIVWTILLPHQVLQAA